MQTTHHYKQLACNSSGATAAETLDSLKHFPGICCKERDVSHRVHHDVAHCEEYICHICKTTWL